MFLLVIPVAIIIAAYIVYSFIEPDGRITRILNKKKPIKLEYFKDHSAAKIIGTIEFVEEPIIAPLSKRPCALYYLHIEEKLSSQRDYQWETVIEEQVSSQYVIKDGDYYAYINAEKQDAYIHQDQKYTSGLFQDAPEHVQELLVKRGFKVKYFSFSRTMRYLEGVLEENEEVAVYGHGIWREATDLDLPEKYGKVLEITSTDDTQVYLSDHPRTTLHKAKKEFEHVKLYKYRMAEQEEV